MYCDNMTKVRGSKDVKRPVQGARMKVSKGAKIRNQYNQVPHLSQNESKSFFRLVRRRKESKYLSKRNTLMLIESPVRLVQIFARDGIRTSISWLLPQRMVALTRIIKCRLM